MARALERQGVQITFVGPLRTPNNALLRARRYVNGRRGRLFLAERDAGVLRSYAHEVATRLAGEGVDAIFSPGTIPIAYLETDLPVIFWTDATFASMVGYYPDFSNVCDASLRAGHAMERAALARADLAFFSSAWAADSAVRSYGADPARVHVLPFGANITAAPDASQVRSLIANRTRDECRLLFVGVDWHRKGGDRALALATELVRLGVPTRLTVAGPPAATVPSSPLIDYAGFVDKSTPSGEARFGHLLGESHFLCLPSRSEAFGIAFCEASAYGVPSISVHTGGIASAVRDGTNGYLFDESEFVGRAGDAVAALMRDFEGSYVPLGLSSHHEYEFRLNWSTSTTTLLEYVRLLVNRPAASEVDSLP
jgi:glycosyltransferase involved in cell wall biosynthesis